MRILRGELFEIMKKKVMHDDNSQRYDAYLKWGVLGYGLKGGFLYKKDGLVTEGEFQFQGTKVLVEEGVIKKVKKPLLR